MAVDRPAIGGGQAGMTLARLPRPPSSETRRLYQVDWRGFKAWCDEAGLIPLPATPATVAAFLGHAAAKLGAGALARRAAAIAARHRAHGLASPAADPAVTVILREARINATPRRGPPPPPALLVCMAAACPGDLAGVRDRALLLLAAAGLDRAALVGLDAEALDFTPTEVVLRLGDPDAEDAPLRAVAVARGANPAICPAQALRDWLDLSDTQFGPVFRKIDRWGNVEHSRLGTDAIRRVLARRKPRKSRRDRERPA